MMQRLDEKHPVEITVYLNAEGELTIWCETCNEQNPATDEYPASQFSVHIAAHRNGE